MSTTITIELCQEDRARLDAILAALQKATPRCDNCVKLVNDLHAVKESATSAPEAEEAPTPNETQPEPEKPAEAKPESDSATQEVTVNDLRSKYMSLATTSKKEQARTLIKLYADKISDIPADKRAEVLEKLSALEG